MEGAIWSAFVYAKFCSEQCLSQSQLLCLTFHCLIYHAISNVKTGWLDSALARCCHTSPMLFLHSSENSKSQNTTEFQEEQVETKLTACLVSRISLNWISPTFRQQWRATFSWLFSCAQLGLDLPMPCGSNPHLCSGRIRLRQCAVLVNRPHAICILVAFRMINRDKMNARRLFGRLISGCTCSGGLPVSGNLAGRVLKKWKASTSKKHKTLEDFVSFLSLNKLFLIQAPSYESCLRWHM